MTAIGQGGFWTEAFFASVFAPQVFFNPAEFLVVQITCENKFRLPSQKEISGFYPSLSRVWERR